MGDDDFEDPVEVEEDYLDDVSHQACYIFKASAKRDTTPRGSPNKKRKVSGTTHVPVKFAKLSQVEDTDVLAEKRWQFFDRFWHSQRLRLESNDLPHEGLVSLRDYLTKATTTDAEHRLRTALLLTGLDGVDYDSVLKRLTTILDAPESVVFASIHNRQCPNLQTALRNLIKGSIVAHSGVDYYSNFLIKHKRLLPLNFDLELLEQFVHLHSISRVVVSLEDVETFDSHLAGELINTLHLWRRSIPFALILGITSTRQLFEQRLSKSSLKNIEAREFNFSPGPDVFSDLIRRAQTPEETHRVYLGPSVVSAFHDVGQLQGKTAHALRSELHFIYMAHTFCNPLSVLADPNFCCDTHSDKQSLCRAIRNAESFKQYCQTTLAEKDKAAVSKVRRLLDDDTELLANACKVLSDGQTAYNRTVQVLHCFVDLYQGLERAVKGQQKSALEVEVQLYQALDDLCDTEAYYDAVEYIKNLSQFQLSTVLNHLTDAAIELLGLRPTCERLSRELQGINGVDGVSCQKSVRVSTPTKRGKTFKSSNTACGLPDAASASTAIITAVSETLRAAKLDLSSLFLHEAFILSSRNTRFKQTFEPQPRAAIERALLRPLDYLGWHQGVADNEDRLHADQNLDVPVVAPAASVLFTLLQEAPTIVNVRDLFDAFRSRVEQGLASSNIAQGDDNSRLLTDMTRFYRALAELKMIGFIKSSTGTQIKRGTKGKFAKSGTHDVDFVAKTSWAGL